MKFSMITRRVVTIDDYNIGDDFTGSIRVGSAPSKKAAATVGV